MIEEIFYKYNLHLKTSQVRIFEKFLDLFIKKNSQINLSAIRDKIWIIEKHFVDSIILNDFIKLNWKVLDIGTWWGFPGIPLAITNENVQFILLDSTRKKIDSVNDFSSELELHNYIWIWWRAEELSSNIEYKWQFDFVVSRATAYFPQIIELSYPYLNKFWKMILYKLFNEEEINEGEKILKKMWMKIIDIKKYNIWEQERILIFCWKCN